MKTVNRSIILLVLGLITSSCTIPRMSLSDDLASNADEYAVKGKQGWLIKQKLSFGDYVTDKVKRGWTSSYQTEFVLRFQGAKEKLQFTSTAPDGSSTNVYCLAKITEKELPLLDYWFSVTLKQEDIFSGQIVARDGVWDFIVYNTNNRNAFQDSNGVLKKDNREIYISNVRTIEDKNSFLTKGLIYGYTLQENGRDLAAVETINNGRVFLRRDLSPDMRHLLQNMTAALLLRSNLSDDVN